MTNKPDIKEHQSFSITVKHKYDSTNEISLGNSKQGHLFKMHQFIQHNLKYFKFR
jgi:hypothetical protein